MTAAKMPDDQYDALFTPSMEIAEGIFDLVFKEPGVGFASMSRHTATKYVQDKVAAIISDLIPTPSPVDCREAFEKWCASEGIYILRANTDCEYHSLATQYRWEAWQAAWNATNNKGTQK